VRPDRKSGAALKSLIQRIESGEPTSPDRGNTILTLVATNQVLDRRALQQLARQVHASMARAIQPFHTLYDGDVLYAVTTGEIENADLDPVALGVLASELAWDAVLSVVQH
jgi:6-aminohexanoate-oligomer endohydrolase